MFRSGVTTKSPEGAKWLCVTIPGGCEVGQISVGPTGLVWAALLDGRALIRVGVTRESLMGDIWVETRGPADNLRTMQISAFGQMVQNISVTGNDQVFAIGGEDRAIYFRTGVHSGDLTGKKWKCLHAPLQVSRASSNASLNRDKLNNSTRSTHSLNRPHSLCDTSGIGDIGDQSHSAPTSLPVGEIGGKHFETPLKNPRAWSPVRSVGSIVGTEVHPESDESLWSDRQDSCIFAEDEELGWGEYEAPWSWVAAGACTIELNQLPNWFVEQGTITQTELDQPWRLQILEELKSRLQSQSYKNIPLAVDTTSWVHVGEGRINLNGSVYVDCVLQLEWVHTNGTLTILNSDGATTMQQFSLNEITCVQCCSEPGSPRLAIHTPNLNIPVIRIQFSSDSQMEEWQTHFTTVCREMYHLTGAPSKNSVWAVTALGDIFVWDSKQLINILENQLYVQELDLTRKLLPIKIPLYTNCIPGTVLLLSGYIHDDIDRFAINLNVYPTFKVKPKNFSELENCALHFNPRFDENVVVRNSMIDGKWGEEERYGENPFTAGKEFVVQIEITIDDYIIYINDNKFCNYRHRLPASSCCMVDVWGKITLSKLKIQTPSIILNPKEMLWRQIGGHLRRIESCAVGVTWGIGFDHTCWVYNGGWGGTYAGTLNSSNINPMADTQDYRVYENQRWNPVTGYTSAGLPTDRYMWSDVTGKQKRTKDQAKLLSVHWQWISDWLVDFHVPGGVDKEGWQYAVDFPASYHANKHFTDYVRRRRWFRRCAVSTMGPWTELGHTKLLDISLIPLSDEEDSQIIVWALATGGQAMVRLDVSASNPSGAKWEHVNSDKPLSSISCGPFNNVWATAANGSAYVRLGIKLDLFQGHKWMSIEPPPGNPLKEISVNEIGVWAVSRKGNLYVRKDISSGWPEGSCWQSIHMDPLIISTAQNTTGFKHVSVGAKEVWATTDGGVILRREGLSKENAAGSGWNWTIAGNWQHITTRAF
ncbi:Integral peroxisomal membrane peroxin [Popillia japonica]|uniref:Integral peroxisomal membrane peroxin n=1 Tax=Popillia japonica TaxID=7064 RepID=A0AAW1K353_POPJA